MRLSYSAFLRLPSARFRLKGRTPVICKLSFAHTVSSAVWPCLLWQPIATTMALTAAARHLGPQLSPLISRTLPSVAPPTTWVARMSFYPPKQRMRCVSGFAFSQPARRHTLPNRVRFTAHRQFASGCSPPRFAATQLPSTTGPWLTPTWTLTMLCTRLHGRTRSDALVAKSLADHNPSPRGRGSYKMQSPPKWWPQKCRAWSL